MTHSKLRSIPFASATSRLVSCETTVTLRAPHPTPCRIPYQASMQALWGRCCRSLLPALLPVLLLVMAALLAPPVLSQEEAAVLDDAAVDAFDQRFTGATLRFDYFHSGTAEQEAISLDALRVEGPWPGSRHQLIDNTGLGKYLFEVRDLKTQEVLWSRGFASIYGEWETTVEARRQWRTFHESQRFPEPRAPVQLALRKRVPEGGFMEIASLTVDPGHRSVNRSPLPTLQEGRVEVWSLQQTGPTEDKLDLLILGDGYTAEDLAELWQHAEAATEALFAVEPFRTHRQRFNVRVVAAASRDRGITNPRAGEWKNTALGLSYDSFGSERYVLTLENRRLRELAALAPYDALLLLANSQKYGGGGIYNLWTTAAAKSGQADYLVAHEMGHSFAGLGDEYYTSSVAYEDFTAPGSEPWEPNITALLDPEALKWKDLVAADTPLPTPWDQETYDAVSRDFQQRRGELRAGGADEAAMEAYFAEVKATTEPMLQGEPHYGSIGAFEGAGYQAKGLYRPAADCIMFTRNPDFFCPVCARGVEAVIDLYAAP
ncbi:MAG: M64 family metallopeptidase [Acidobacteriota bacterium]